MRGKTLFLFPFGKLRKFTNQSCGHPDTSQCTTCSLWKVTFQARPWLCSNPEKQERRGVGPEESIHRIASGLGCSLDVVYKPGVSRSSNQIDLSWFKTDRIFTYLLWSLLALAIFLTHRDITAVRKCSDNNDFTEHFMSCMDFTSRKFNKLFSFSCFNWHPIK